MTYTTRIGHAHLKVRDLARSVDFYTRFFKLNVVEQVGDYFAFLSGGEMHHELALQALGPGAMGPHPGAVGLYHVAFEVPDERSLALAYQALRKAGVRVQPVDHRISWAIYFSDPDGNGLEIYWDTRHLMTGDSDWSGYSLPLPEEKLLASLAGGDDNA